MKRMQNWSLCPCYIQVETTCRSTETGQLAKNGSPLHHWPDNSSIRLRKPTHRLKVALPQSCRGFNHWGPTPACALPKLPEPAQQTIINARFDSLSMFSIKHQSFSELNATQKNQLCLHSQGSSRPRALHYLEILTCPQERTHEARRECFTTYEIRWRSDRTPAYQNEERPMVKFVIHRRSCLKSALEAEADHAQSTSMRTTLAQEWTNSLKSICLIGVHWCIGENLKFHSVCPTSCVTALSNELTNDVKGSLTLSPHVQE